MLIAFFLSVGPTVSHADDRGLAGGVFVESDIGTWRGDLIQKLTKPAPSGGFSCSNVTRWAIGEIMPQPQNFLVPHEPDVGGDYGNRPDKKMFYNLGAKANYKNGITPPTPNPMYVFCWNNKADGANPTKASTAYLVPAATNLTVCEVADRVGGTLICH